jgi:uncharacterized membrane protein YeaQ/YmgE (transglycosylase-associated protein family)
MLYFIISWTIFGLLVGFIAKWLHPGEEPTGFLPTLAVGVIGSYLGGLVNWIFGFGSVFDSSGFIMSILGGIICCAIYRLWEQNQQAK